MLAVSPSRIHAQSAQQPISAAHLVSAEQPTSPDLQQTSPDLQQTSPDLQQTSLGTQQTSPDTQPAQPSAPPPDPRIQTAAHSSSQPPVADGPNLPFEPEPRQPSLTVTGPLGSVSPRRLQNGITTPIATAQPLKLSLNDAVQLGLQHNLTLAIDTQSARQVSGLQLDAFNALIPTLSASGYSSTKEVNLAAMGFNPSVVAPLLPAGTTFSTIVKYDVTNAQLNLNQQLFNLPAYEIYRAAKVQARIVDLQTLSDRGAVVQSVAGQYLRVLADQASIRNGESQLLTDRELERQALARKDAGTGTNLDLLRTTVDRQQREQELAQDRNTYGKDKIQLNRAMGIAADQQLDLIDPVPYHELAALPLETAKQVAYTRRKDLLGLQAQLESARLQRKAITYEYLPAATLGGYYGVIGQTFGGYHGNFVAQGGINLPIFEEARFKGDRQVADAQLSRLRSQLTSLHADIEQQIRSSMLDVQTANDLVKFATSNVDLASQEVTDALLRYRSGIDDTLPVVQAQSTLAGAQSQLVQALFQFNTAKLQLARNTGVLESQYDSYLNE